jgi:DNA adenine methylase
MPPAPALADDDHAELLEFLKTLRGTVVLSGYPHDLYDASLRDWRRIERPALADNAKPRTEVLWINRATADLFGEAA